MGYHTHVPTTHRPAVLVVANVEGLPRQEPPVLRQRRGQAAQQRGGEAQGVHQGAALEGGDAEGGGVRLEGLMWVFGEGEGGGGGWMGEGGGISLTINNIYTHHTHQTSTTMTMTINPRTS